MVELRSPEMRAGIIDALEVLATLTPETTERWPGLTEAVHWLVDDTGWDLFDMADSIGWTLRDEHEVATLKAVLDPLLVVLVDIGPTEPDAACLRHQRWPDVRTAARAAHRSLTTAAG